MQLVTNNETPNQVRARILEASQERFRHGNDPHNQEIAQCPLEDYAKNRGFDRDRLLLACVQHTAVHRKYGDFLESSQRYEQAMGLTTLQ